VQGRAKGVGMGELRRIGEKVRVEWGGGRTGERRIWARFGGGKDRTEER